MFFSLKSKIIFNYCSSRNYVSSQTSDIAGHQYILTTLNSPGGRADFPQFFCPAVNRRACTGLHLVWACKIDDDKVEFGYRFNNHLNPFRSFLSLLVVK